MEDIAGIRIMCQFVDDISKVVELIRKKDMTLLYEKIMLLMLSLVATEVIIW